MAKEEDTNAIRDVLRTVFRRRKLFLLTWALVAILILVAQHWVTTVKYTGRSTFTRTDPRRLALGPRQGEIDTFETLRNTLARDLARTEALRAVAETVGMFRGLPREEDGSFTSEGKRLADQIVEQLREDIQIEWPVKAEQVDEITVSYTSADPELAFQVPNELVKLYIKSAFAKLAAQLGGVSDGLNRQLHAAESELAQAKKALFEWERENTVPVAPAVLTEEIERLEEELREGKAEEELLLAEKTNIHRLLGLGATEEGAETPMVANPKKKEIRDHLSALEEAKERMLLVQRKKELHPDVVAINREIALTEKRLEEEPDRIPGEELAQDPRHEAWRLEMKMKLENLDLRLKFLRERLERTGEQIDRKEAMRTNYNTLKPTYDALAGALADANAKVDRLQEEAEKVERNYHAEAARRKTQLEHIEKAERKYRPSSPKLSMLLGLAVVGGLGAAGGLMFLTHRLDRTVATPEEAQQFFELPVHGVIGEIVTPRQRTSRSLRRFILTPAVTLVVAAAFALAVMSNTLRVTSPEEYHKWASAPADYVLNDIVRPALDGLTSFVQ